MLFERINSQNAPMIIDPRSGKEFKGGHIPGAINAPVGKILLNMAHLPEVRDTEIVLACMHGQRAILAKAIMSLYGYRNTSLLEGYILAWQKAGFPLEK